MPCATCQGSGKIKKSAMGTRLYEWVVECKTCEGTGMTMREMKEALDADHDCGCPTGHWVDGWGPGHRIWIDD
jgi:DnaJ-class molecular chaperone